MDLASLGKSGRGFARAGEIANVLAKHGLSPLLEKLKLTSSIPLTRRIKGSESRETDPERVRAVCEELGPTFVKLGQLLSQREDIVGPAMAAELSKLQDDVPPFPIAEAKKIIREELGEQVFASIDEKPLASASIGVVYGARLKNGRKVIIKVQRPGIRGRIDEDVEIMRHLAGLLTKYVPESRPFDPVGIVEEFERSIHKELDYRLEARNAERFYQNFKREKFIKIPETHPQYCTPRVIVMERVEGVKFKDLGKSDRIFDKKKLAEREAAAFFKMVIEDGFFHADPHPSNVLAMPGDRVCFLDFGLAGHLDREMVDDLADLFVALMSGNANAVTEALEELGIVSTNVDEAELKRDIQDVMDTYYGTGLEQVPLGEVLNEMSRLMRKHGCSTQKEFVLLARGVMQVEGTCRKLDPQFNTVAALKPFAQQVAKRRSNPMRLLGGAVGAATQMGRLAKIIPGSLKRILGKAESGKLTMEFEHKDLNVFTSEMERTSNKIAIALILAALIVGSSLIMVTDKGVSVFGFPLLGLAGFVFSAILGLWLVVSIMRYRSL